MKAYSGSKGRHLQLHTFLASTFDGDKAPQYVHKRKYTYAHKKSMEFIPRASFHYIHKCSTILCSHPIGLIKWHRSTFRNMCKKIVKTLIPGKWCIELICTATNLHCVKPHKFTAFFPNSTVLWQVLANSVAVTIVSHDSHETELLTPWTPLIGLSL